MKTRKWPLKIKPSALAELEFSNPDEKTAKCLSRICPVVIHSGDSIRSRWHLGERKTFNYLWVFIGSGEGFFNVRGVEFAVKANDFIWIPPDTLHEMSGTSEKMHCIWAHIDLLFEPGRTHLFRVPAGIRDLAPWKEFIHPPFGDEAIDSLCGLINLSNPLQVKILLEELCRTYRLNPDMKLKLAGLILEILEEVIVTTRHKKNLDEKIAKTIVHIREHLNRNLNVGDLAKSIGLSISYFRKIFRTTYGIGPVAFHRKLRIREGCNLMINEGMNVSEAATALGFSSIHNFSRAFKEIMHISPKRFCQRRLNQPGK